MWLDTVILLLITLGNLMTRSLFTTCIYIPQEFIFEMSFLQFWYLLFRMEEMNSEVSQTSTFSTSNLYSNLLIRKRQSCYSCTSHICRVNRIWGWKPFLSFCVNTPLSFYFHPRREQEENFTALPGVESGTLCSQGTDYFCWTSTTLIYWYDSYTNTCALFILT